MAHLQLGALGPNHGNLGELEALGEEPVFEGLGWWPETFLQSQCAAPVARSRPRVEAERWRWWWC